MCWSPGPSQQECDFIWKWGLYRGDLVKLGSLGWVLTQYVLVERGDLDPDRHAGRAPRDVGGGEQDAHVQVTAKTPPESTGKDWCAGPAPGSSGGTCPAGALPSDFQPPD